ncbi:MAG: hypothetical protein ACFCD0_03780 [Gemmataceae bacterium]
MFPTTVSTMVVVALIAQLGSPNYSARATARYHLSRMAPLAVDHLKAAEKHPDPEVRRNAKQVLASYYNSQAPRLAQQTRPSNWPRLPWLDMLPANHPQRDRILAYYLPRAQKTIGRKAAPEWEDYRLATQLYMEDLFRNEQRPDQVRQLLNSMADHERDWIRRNGTRYNPPVQMPLSEEF